MDDPLRAGDVISFSAGCTQHGPTGYRIVRGDGAAWTEALARLPGVRAILGGDRPPMVINAYPATISAVPFGVLVDTYLSQTTVSRALQLAATRGHAAVLVGQPLFVADALFAHLKVTPNLPDRLLLVVGGYVLPNSLQHAPEETCRAHGAAVSIVQCYGVAEVDAALLISVQRDAAGRAIYLPRSSRVRVEIGPDEQLLLDGFDTGDYARWTGPEEEGLLIMNSMDRLAPIVLDVLESWTSTQWRRRTGYLFFGETIRVQTRLGHAAVDPEEVHYYSFADRYGSLSWLDKPRWSICRP